MTDQNDETPRSVPPLMVATWESATSDPDPLIALGATRALIALLSAWEAKLAVEAVAGGATWGAIGSSLGVSRQAAWEHLHDHVEEFRDHIKTEARALRDRHKQEMQEFREEVRRKAKGYHKFR